MNREDVIEYLKTLSDEELLTLLDDVGFDHGILHGEDAKAIWEEVMKKPTKKEIEEVTRGKDFFNKIGMSGNIRRFFN